MAETVSALKKNPKWKGRRGPVVLVIMDGVGYGKYEEGDAVKASRMDWLNKLTELSPHTKLKAHGTAVGLPSDADMGNSEVGHNAMGCGRVFAQGAKLVSTAIETGSMFAADTWKKLVKNVKDKNTTLHFIGLISDGNVHSHIDHLKAMIEQAHKEGVKTVRVHALLDGRDVDPTSALDYITPLEEYLASFSDADYCIASGGGRMYMTMDRYNADWSMVERGWKAHVLGEGRQFPSATEAIKTYRAEVPGVLDQDMHEFVIVKDGKPVGTINDGDSVIYFNFRGDRALEMTNAFETPADGNFPHFDRKRVPAVEYAGMMEYDGDLHIPAQFLVSPPSIDRTMGEYLTKSGVRLLAISETQKYGHVTYFFNGNKLGKFDENLEDYVEIKSDVVPFEQRPWMKCAEITDEVIKAIKSGKYDHIRLNFPNGDMVGHTGVFNAVVCSMEAMDLQLGRLKEAIDEAGGIMCITADHGNSDDMYEHKKDGAVAQNKDGSPKAKTSHSLNPVPGIIYDPEYQGEYELTLKDGLGISSWPATIMDLMGLVPPEDYDASMVTLK
ncbi:MAG: 2,3-bisphosphoglycerate-independent phosphoglycerate mutase [Candidatus Treponema excrementipullorum]|nr:2,3-bisphosphoglycerate-independent phosphoglycerate mutase [Spirochaetia bacterium]MDD7013006.1 2,3-bisphosphoglycerate-independent phosphoglycerate mutase [Candidatus Treponema excrementipullorum]MCI6953700.1 2,3-bisphosphoglycerate-independent phosphoglycerate mutase [Spirochaetia bacterium]MCI7589472.1 2,3-bisphosphoglycerate-independent phosphoglycerate mutase [Spirochaetia bacterium]MDY4464882.1 2,3-bisphosphoglycerate-independent phosphoglycerate mutase [Candidatus Treponema excrement